MKETPITLQMIAALSALANGIIPPDDRDAGDASVNAGPGIAGRMRFSPYANVYLDGLKMANDLAKSHFNTAPENLDPAQMHQLLAELGSLAPFFFRPLRADVCALYLSDPGVWQRIGFPGESTEQGGYPDFDQPQT